MDIVNALMGLDWTAILTSAAVIVSSMSVLSCLTPNTSDDRVVQFLLDWINRCALLFGKAKIGK